MYGPPVSDSPTGSRPNLKSLLVVLILCYRGRVGGAGDNVTCPDRRGSPYPSTHSRALLYLLSPGLGQYSRFVRVRPPEMLVALASDTSGCGLFGRALRGSARTRIRVRQVRASVRTRPRPRRRPWTASPRRSVPTAVGGGTRATAPSSPPTEIARSTTEGEVCSGAIGRREHPRPGV